MLIDFISGYLIATALFCIMLSFYFRSGGKLQNDSKVEFLEEDPSINRALDGFFIGLGVMEEKKVAEIKKKKKCYIITNNSHKTVNFKCPQLNFESEHSSVSNINTESLKADMSEDYFEIKCDKFLAADGVIITVNKGGTVYKKDTSIGRIIEVNIESDPFWNLKVKCDNSQVKMSMISLWGEEAVIDNLEGKYNSGYEEGISHILTPGNKRIDLRKLTDGVTEDGYAYRTERVSFNSAIVHIIGCGDKSRS